LKIKISGFEFGTNELEYSGKVEEIGLGEPFFGKYLLLLQFDKSHQQLLMNAELRVSAKFECDRCTNEFESDRVIRFTIVYLFDEKSGETDDPDVYYLSREEDKIDISAELYDYAHLDIPFKKLCREDCKGICPKCGKDLNTGQCNCEQEEFNPVWKDLEKLKDQFNDD
jgi:Predicted metal-binding, possibly nucleic acid-binding protein